MASNVYLIVAVSLLCGFLVAFPPVYSIRCYHKTVYNKQVINDEAVDCKEKGYDKCGTLTFNLDSSSYNVLIKNCTRSTLDCDEAVACERASAVYKKHGLTVMDCSSSCCDSDNCNAPVKRRTAMGLKIKEQLRKLITRTDLKSHMRIELSGQK